MYSEYKDQRDAAISKYDYAKVNQIDNDAYLYEIREIPPAKQSGAARYYERRIEEELEGILQTTVGRCLFNSLKASEKIWITPKTSMTETDYNSSAANTFQYPDYQGGGIRIHYNLKKDINSDQDTPLEILFHELIHAYRFGLVGDIKENAPYVVTWNGDREEVFATIMQSVYLSCIEEPSVYYSYDPPRKTTPEEAYKKLAFDDYSLSLLTYFINSDPLTKRVALLKPPVYNPWRDYFNIKETSYTAVGRKPPNVFR